MAKARSFLSGRWRSTWQPDFPPESAYLFKPVLELLEARLAPGSTLGWLLPGPLSLGISDPSDLSLMDAPATGAAARTGGAVAGWVQRGGRVDPSGEAARAGAAGGMDRPSRVLGPDFLRADRWSPGQSLVDILPTQHPLPGGRSDKPLDATGFWHLEQPDGLVRDWLVDPDGNLVFGLGVNSVMRATNCNGMAAYIQRDTPFATANEEWARLSTGYSQGYTDDQPLGFNSVGAFTQTNDFDSTGGDSYMIRTPDNGGAGAPYSVVLNPDSQADSLSLKNVSGTVLRTGFSNVRVGDPYNPSFLAEIDRLVARDVAPRANDPNLQMWFVGNETGMFDVAGHGGGGVRDFRAWIWSSCPSGSSIDNPLCASHAFASFLRDRYGSIAALNAQWQSSYPGFQQLVDQGPRPVPYVQNCNLTCREDMQRFVHNRLLREWVTQVTTRIRAADPNHLVASPRLAISNASTYKFWSTTATGNPDRWADSNNNLPSDQPGLTYTPWDLLARNGNAGFDLIAINGYTGSSTFTPSWFGDGLNRMNQGSGLPVYVSEFGIRQRISGWSNQGGAGAFVTTQAQRGQRYASQMDQFISFPFVVGANWHRWADDYVPGNTSHQIDSGLVQCDDPVRGFTAGTRWDALSAAMASVNGSIYDQIAATTGW